MNEFDPRDVVIAQIAAALLSGTRITPRGMEAAVEEAIFLLATAAEKREAIENSVDAAPEA